MKTKLGMGMTNKSVHLVASASLLAVLWLAGGCGTTSGSTESETHFLAECQDQCDGGLECICGVCTQTCASVDPCRDLAAAASCELSAAGECAGEAISVCDVGCGSDADCDDLGSGYTCDAGACRWVTNLASTETGGAGGSSTTSDAGGTGGGGSAGETAVLPQRGNLMFQISGCTMYTGGVGADPAESESVRLTQLPALDGTNPGRRLEDGEEEAGVSCRVGGFSPNFIQAFLFGRQVHPANSIMESVGITVDDGWIDETDGVGEAYIRLDTGGVSYAPVDGSICTLTLDSPEPDNQFFLEPGRVYARFDCPELADPPTTGCSASGAFVFERCEE